MNYKRKVTYFNHCNNGTTGQATGFLKLEIRGDKVKITINIQEPYRNTQDKPFLCFYHEMGENLAAVKICELDRQDNVLTFQEKTPWENVFDTGRDLYTFDGVLVFYSANDFFVGDFSDRDRSRYEIKFAEKNDKNSKDKNDNDDKDLMVIKSNDDQIKNEKTIEGNDDQIKSEETIEGNDNQIKSEETTEENDEQNKNKEKQEVNDDQIKDEVKQKGDENNNDEIKDVDKYTDNEKIKVEKERIKESICDSFDDIIESYPKLPMYNMDELFDCVRINPRDIGKLDIGNWKLGTNSFLTHGYYTYQYLMLGRMRFGDGHDHAVLGVPGVYTNREKYMANMFGFNTFIPIKKTNARNGSSTGRFGYWIVEINQ